MVATVTGHLSDAEMAKLAADKATMANLGSSAPSTPAKFVFLAAFDGTNNDKDQVAAGNTKLGGHPYQTNVANIYDQADAASKSNPNLVAKYYPGVGTGGENGNQFNAAFSPTQAVRYAADKALADFTVAANIYLQDNPTATYADLAASAVGFSRGGVTAIVFSQMLYEQGLVLPDGTVVAPPGVRVIGLLPIDPVATNIDGNFAIPPNVEGPVLVPRASEDPRGYFNALDLSGDDRVVTVPIKANHTGTGGGDDKNGTGAAVLEGGTGFLQKQGVNISNVLPENTFDMSEPAAIRAEQFQQAANGDVMGPNWPTKTDADGNRLTIPVVVTASQTSPDGSTTTTYTNYKGNTVTTTKTATEDGSIETIVTKDKSTGAVLSQSKQETSADGLTTSVSLDNGSGAWKTTTIAKTVGDDGSFSTITTYPNGKIVNNTVDDEGKLFSRDVTTPQPDGSTATQHYGGTDLKNTPQYTTTTTTDDEGSKTVSTTHADGKTEVTVYNSDNTIFTPTVTTTPTTGNTPQQDLRNSEINDQNTSEPVAAADDIPTFTPIAATADLPPDQVITLADSGSGTQTDGGNTTGYGNGSNSNTDAEIETNTPVADVNAASPATNNVAIPAIPAVPAVPDPTLPVISDDGYDPIDYVDTRDPTDVHSVDAVNGSDLASDQTRNNIDAGNAAGALGIANTLIGLKDWDNASDYGRVQTVVTLYNQVNNLANIGMPDMGGLGAGLGFIGAVQNGDYGGMVVGAIGEGNAIGSAMDMGAMAVSEAVGAALGMNAVNVIPGLNLIFALTNIEENPFLDNIYYLFNSKLCNKYAGYILDTSSKYDFSHVNAANDDVWAVRRSICSN